MSTNRGLGQKLISKWRQERKMQRRGHHLILNDDDIAFLDGYLDAYETFPDGAFQAACESAIRECPRFEHCDPHEVWLAWCKEKAT